MKTAPLPKARPKPLILTRCEQNILHAVYYYRFMAAQDVTRLLYSSSSLTYVRGLLSRLAGGEDGRNAQYLYRFQLPKATIGGCEKVYTLGSKGRDFIVNELGLPVRWRLRPSKLKHLSYSQCAHNILLTRFLVSAKAWAANQPDFRISQTRICYDLAMEASTTVDISQDTLSSSNPRKTESLKLIPDAWVEFERLKNGEHECFMPTLLEIDKGSEHSRKFKDHVRSRIEFIRSGGYSKMFGTDAVIIIYITTGDLPEYRETRRNAMCRWTQEVLTDLRMENWASIFRFASVVFEELYSTPLFDELIWYKPSSPAPVMLFAS